MLANKPTRALIREAGAGGGAAGTAAGDSCGGGCEAGGGGDAREATENPTALLNERSPKPLAMAVASQRRPNVGASSRPYPIGTLNSSAAWIPAWIGGEIASGRSGTERLRWPLGKVMESGKRMASVAATSAANCHVPHRPIVSRFAPPMETPAWAEICANAEVP